MAQRILTSLHGRKVGLDAKGNLVVGGKRAVTTDDNGLQVKLQGAPDALDATGALTAALIAKGVVTSSTAAAVTATLATGTQMDTAFGTLVEIGEAIEWSAVNTGGSNAFTVTQNTDHTVVGAGAVAANNSGLFRSKRTAANTWVTYRIA